MGKIGILLRVVTIFQFRMCCIRPSNLRLEPKFHYPFYTRHLIQQGYPSTFSQLLSLRRNASVWLKGYSVSPVSLTLVSNGDDDKKKTIYYQFGAKKP